MKYISISISIIIIAAFCFILFSDTLNTPSFDDYFATVSFIRALYFEPHTFLEKLELLSAPHNEHRIILSRSLAAAYFYIFRQINFTNLVVIQNFFLLGSFVLLYRILVRQNFRSYTALLICSVFLFNLAFFQVSFYYWGGIQHYTVFFFSALGLYYLNKSQTIGSKHFVAAVVFILFAVFCFGNGFLALFLGGFLLWSQRKYVLLRVWTVVGFVLLFIVFQSILGYEKPSQVPFRVDWMARLLFTFSGSFLYVNPPAEILRYANIIICTIAGAGVLGYWVWLFVTGYARKQPLIYCLFSWPLLTALIISISRFDSKSAGGIAPRYMFFSSIIPIILLLILWDKKLLKQGQLMGVAMAGVLVWGFSFYFNLREFRKMNTDIKQRIVRWQTDPTTPLVYYNDFKTDSEIRRWAIDHGVISKETGANILP